MKGYDDTNEGHDDSKNNETDATKIINNNNITRRTIFEGKKCFQGHEMWLSIMSPIWRHISHPHPARGRANQTPENHQEHTQLWAVREVPFKNDGNSFQ